MVFRDSKLFTSKMSSSVAKSGLTYSSVGDQIPPVTIETESSCVQGVNNEESTAESSKQQDMVGWTVYKRYGIHVVKGVLLSYNSETKIYEVQYKDGKREKVTKDNVMRYLSPCKPGTEQPRTSSLRMNADNNVRPVRKAVTRKRAGTSAAQQPMKDTRGSPSGETQKRAGTSAAQQHMKDTRGSPSGETQAANSGNQGKKRYRSLRMNAGR